MQGKLPFLTEPRKFAADAVRDLIAGLESKLAPALKDPAGACAAFVGTIGIAVLEGYAAGCSRSLCAQAALRGVRPASRAGCARSVAKLSLVCAFSIAKVKSEARATMVTAAATTAPLHTV